MVALLAWTGASIFWSLTTPTTVEPAPAMELDPARAAQSIAARHPFGEAPAPTTAAAVRSAPADIALRGVIAPGRKGQPAVAVLAIGGKAPISVREGEEAVPGTVLYRVHAREVEIKRDGEILSIKLPDRTQPGSGKAPDAVTPPPAAAASNPRNRERSD